MKNRKPGRKQWSVSEKLEVVQARQQGLLLNDPPTEGSFGDTLDELMRGDGA